MSLREHVVGRAREDPGAGSFRFGAVFLLTLTLCVFLIVAPDADWARAVALALQSAALIVVVATSRASAAVRRKRTVAAGWAAVVILLAVATGVLPRWVVYVLGVAMSVAIPIAIVGGLVRLMRLRGVTLQTVAGALAIYLLLGIVFAWLYAFFDQLTHGPFFTGWERWCRARASTSASPR